MLGTKTLSETLSDRDNIAKDLKGLIDDATDPWGIDVSFLIIQNDHNSEHLASSLDPESWGQGRSSPSESAESHGCWGWGFQRGPSKGNCL